MKTFLRLMVLTVLAMALGGCASFLEAMAAASRRQQQDDGGYEDYQHTPRNTSAAGIK